jgi:hypothetical protein
MQPYSKLPANLIKEIFSRPRNASAGNSVCRSITLMNILESIGWTSLYNEQPFSRCFAYQRIDTAIRPGHFY